MAHQNCERAQTGEASRLLSLPAVAGEPFWSVGSAGGNAGDTPGSTAQHRQLVSSSTRRGRAIAAGSRTSRVANRESGVFSGFTSMSSPP